MGHNQQPYVCLALGHSENRYAVQKQVKHSMCHAVHIRDHNAGADPVSLGEGQEHHRAIDLVARRSTGEEQEDQKVWHIDTAHLPDARYNLP